MRTKFKAAFVSLLLLGSLVGCSGGSSEDGLEEPMEDSEELSQEDLDSAIEDVENWSDDESAEGSDDSIAANDESLDMDSDSEDTLENIEQAEEIAESLDAVGSEDIEDYNLEDDRQDMVADDSVSVPESGDEAVPALTDNGMTAEESMEEGMMDASEPMGSNEVRYVTRPGDTLGSIAASVYGDRSRWRDLAEHNAIADPSRIFPGDIIVFPVNSQTQEFANRLSRTQLATVVVEQGDTLSAIAQRVLGDGSAWKYLYRFNEDKIKDPDVISVGLVISYLRLDSSYGVASGPGNDDEQVK